MKTIFALWFALCLSAGAALPGPAWLASATKAAGGGASWTPATPSGLTEWLKADAMVMANGAAVATWTNSAGLDATQGTSANQPFFTNSCKNSLPAVQFDGVNDFMTTAAWGSALTQPFTVVLVFCCIVKPNATYIYDSVTGGRAGFYGQNVNVFSEYAGTTEVDIGSSDTSWHYILTEWSGATTTNQIDNGSPTQISASPGTANMTGVTLGDAIDGVGVPTKVLIGEMIIYSGRLSAANKTGLTNYLNTRWAIY